MTPENCPDLHMYTVVHMGGHTHITVKEMYNDYVLINTKVMDLGVAVTVTMVYSVLVSATDEVKAGGLLNQ